MNYLVIHDTQHASLPSHRASPTLAQVNSAMPFGSSSLALTVRVLDFSCASVANALSAVLDSHRLVDISRGVVAAAEYKKGHYATWSRVRCWSVFDAFISWGDICTENMYS